MNVEIGTEAALFPEKEYINGIVVAVLNPAQSYSGVYSTMVTLFLQCGVYKAHLVLAVH
jgi:hypothetical protein